MGPLDPEQQDQMDDAEVAAREALREWLSDDPDRGDRISSRFIGGPKLRLYVAAAYWAGWMIQHAGFDQPRVVLFDAETLATGVTPASHEVVAVGLLNAVIDDRLDEFAPEFMGVEEQVSFDAAMFLLAELGRRVRMTSQAVWN